MDGAWLALPAFRCLMDDKLSGRAPDAPLPVPVEEVAISSAAVSWPNNGRPMRSPMAVSACGMPPITSMEVMGKATSREAVPAI